MDKEYLTIRQTADLFNVTERTLTRLCKQGKIKGAILIGGQWRIDVKNFRGTSE